MGNIEELKRRLNAGETTARALVGVSLNSAQELNDTLNAFLDLDRTGALTRADTLDERIRAKGDIGQLAGIPLAIKDNICVRGYKPLVARVSSATTIHLITRRLSNVSWAQGQSLSVRRTATSLRWARQTRTPPLDQCEIPGTLRAYPGVVRRFGSGCCCRYRSGGVGV